LNIYHLLDICLKNGVRQVGAAKASLDDVDELAPAIFEACGSPIAALADGAGATARSYPPPARPTQGTAM
jgi:hypothetical protein